MRHPTEGLRGNAPGRSQRVLLDELWKQTTGKGVRVAVIDTGVDVKNPQLKSAVDAKQRTEHAAEAEEERQG